jgi:Domain of unknown function (DUF4124)
MRFTALLLLLVTCLLAQAQVYRWVDEKGTVHYSNAMPPAGTKAVTVDIDAKPGAPPAESAECYTVRCQGERLEQRLARREETEARLAAERAKNTPPPPRGLTFSRYISIQRGMSTGEVLGIAGDPDLLVDEGLALSAPATAQSGRATRGAARTALAMKTFTYLPTPADPFTTIITLVGGRVSEIERIRKF